MSDWTPERALVAARNSDFTSWDWRASVDDPIYAHQFPAEVAWRRSRCGAVVRTPRWISTLATRRCPDCRAASEAAIAAEVEAILAVAARTAVA
jgi:hypothetical protein